jgi:Transcriptional regulator
VLACPPGHRFSGHRISLEDLRGETLIMMQEGAGVREVIEDELRNLGVRLRDMNVRLELGLQESVVSAVRAGYGVAFISRTSIEVDLEAEQLAEARVIGLEAEREIWMVRAGGRSETRAARAFLEFAREQLV